MITVHMKNTFTICSKPSCNDALGVIVSSEELKNDIFAKYYFVGHTSPVWVPRTDPRLPNSVGFLRSERGRVSQDDFLCFGDSHPLVPVRWGDPGSLREKVLTYGALARHNLHLPLIVVTPHSAAPASAVEEFRRKIDSLYAYCAMTNRATFLPMFACIRCSGWFGCLPVELVSLVIRAYFGVEA